MFPTQFPFITIERSAITWKSVSAPNIMNTCRSTESFARKSIKLHEEVETFPFCVYSTLNSFSLIHSPFLVLLCSHTQRKSTRRQFWTNLELGDEILTWVRSIYKLDEEKVRRVALEASLLSTWCLSVGWLMSQHEFFMMTKDFQGFCSFSKPRWVEFAPTTEQLFSLLTKRHRPTLRSETFLFFKLFDPTRKKREILRLNWIRLRFGFALPKKDLEEN